jgi:AcrR family transcriptional regulator
MMKVTKKSDETLIAKRRKEQVLAAAADCVRRDGFHRTSMSQISAAAGMSSGHIYHYFDSKEGIIAGIVAREYNELGQLIDEIKDATKESDVISAIVDQAAKSTSRYIDHSHASLAMEILAESARNPEVASLVQQSDEEVFQSFHNLLGGGTPEVKSRCEILAALLEGLSIRALRNPNLETSLDKEMLQRVVRHVLTS